MHGTEMTLDPNLRGLLLIASKGFSPLLRDTPLVENALVQAYDCLVTDKEVLRLLARLNSEPQLYEDVDRLFADSPEEAGQKSLLSLLHAGADKQLNELYLNLTKQVSNVIKQFPILREDSADLLHDAFVIISTGRTRYDPAKVGRTSQSPESSFYAYVKGIVLNVARKALRQRQRVARQSDAALDMVASHDKSPEQECAKNECTRDELERKVFRILTDNLDREVFRRHFIDGEAAPAIALIVQRKPMAIYQRIHRIRMKLRDSGEFDNYVNYA